MQLLFKQRLFSWFDSYDIYDEAGNTVYTVQGRLAWGHKLEISDSTGRKVGMVVEEITIFYPRFELYMGDQYVGIICREATIFRPVYSLECNGWTVKGDIFGYDYEVTAPDGRKIMFAEKRLFNWTDTYVIDIADPADALLCLMIVLAIDAARCSED